MANKLCAQQTAKYWRKSPKGFFDKLKRLSPEGERRLSGALVFSAGRHTAPDMAFFLVPVQNGADLVIH